MKTRAVIENALWADVKKLKDGFDQAGRDMRELHVRVTRLSSDIEELKKWAAALPKSSDSDFSHTHKPI